MGIEYCVYENVRKRGAGEILKMREACNSCRSAEMNGSALQLMH